MRSQLPQQALIDEVVAERVRASNGVEHFKKKHADEEAAIKDAETAAKSTEDELLVRAHHLLRTPSLNLLTRIGPSPLGNWFQRSSKTLGP